MHVRRGAAARRRRSRWVIPLVAGAVYFVTFNIMVALRGELLLSDMLALFAVVIGGAVAVRWWRRSRRRY